MIFIVIISNTTHLVKELGSKLLAGNYWFTNCWGFLYVWPLFVWRILLNSEQIDWQTENLHQQIDIHVYAKESEEYFWNLKSPVVPIFNIFFVYHIKAVLKRKNKSATKILSYISVSDAPSFYSCGLWMCHC